MKTRMKLYVFLLDLLGLGGQLLLGLLGLILELGDAQLQGGLYRLQRANLLAQYEHLVAELIELHDQIVFENVQSVPWIK